MNRRHRSAQLAGRASVGLHTQLYFRDFPQSEKAYVLAVHHDKLTVLVPKFGIEGTIYLADEEEKGQLEYDETEHTLAFQPEPSAAAVSVKVRGIPFFKRSHLKYQQYQR